MFVPALALRLLNAFLPIFAPVESISEGFAFALLKQLSPICESIALLTISKSEELQQLFPSFALAIFNAILLPLHLLNMLFCAFSPV